MKESDERNKTHAKLIGFALVFYSLCFWKRKLYTIQVFFNTHVQFVGFSNI